ncbi:hypothetical protein ATCC90586_009911 [Pythium insidiosum]|nr:hypothetical protein ATCC90586_009911 [Pythium insidiosum]
MDVGTLVWIQDPSDADVWVSAQVARLEPAAPPATHPRAVVVQLSASGREVELSLAFTPRGECVNVLLQNQPHELDQNDLVTLPHLHEASILHALRQRYARDAIYTRIGEILISINPFKRLPALYTRQVVDAYGLDAASPAAAVPHLFGIARAAYADVVRNGRNQSILISGESGAGKTEATKIMMKYFALTCGQSSSSPAQTQAPLCAETRTAETDASPSIETQVLQSNPVLEAFGNARTVRNDNSSRFGKFIELQLDAERHAIVGARIRTYLLEKIRVINQAPHERNFHIFYELTAAVNRPAAGSAGTPAWWTPALAQPWRLDSGASHFRLLNQSACYARRDGVDDAAQFGRTLRAMEQIGLKADEILRVLAVVAALLQLGNVAFEERPRAPQNVMEASVVPDSAPFETAAELLGVAPERLAFAMTKRVLSTATETLTVSLDAAQAETTRNALVMECYRLLFGWLVAQINAQIRARSPRPCDFIGLLDIFGFEDMAVNSFEQLCINYANEALQHQFNQFVFDEEQRLYRDEGIAWAFIDFPDNVACLELFERKPIGLFSLTDGECLFPQGTDRALLAKLYAEFEKKAPHPHFLAPAAGWQRQTHFVVAHYAGKVNYAIDGFLNKNRDSFCETAATLLATSSLPLVQGLSQSSGVADTSSSSPSPTPPSLSHAGGGSSRRLKSALAAVSVGTQFKQQLGELLETIRGTAPHYVRCIKPNDRNVCDAFSNARVVEQLRSGGVLEAVRVARAGFPVRLAHRQFLERYERVLLHGRRASTVASTTASTRPLDRCLARLRGVIASAEGGVSLGRTRVFFRRRPYEELEQLRVLVLRRAAVEIQRTFRGFGTRRAFNALRHAVRRLQARHRGRRARAFVLWLRQTKAAARLQTATRRFLAMSRYSRFQWAVLRCQSHWRRRAAARLAQALREAKAATLLAATWRGFVARRVFRSIAGAVLALQCALRRRIARRTLAALRAESRNVAKLQHDNLQLQRELAALRQQLMALKLTDATESCADNQRGSEPRAVVNADVTAAVDAPLAAAEKCVDAVAVAVATPRLPELTLADEVRHPSPSPPRPRASGAISVLPPRRASLPVAAPAASTSKAELDRSTRRASLVDAKVRLLREQLQAAAKASNPEEEQELVMKQFVASQLLSKRLSHRSSGTFDLELPQDCDNNSALDGDDGDAEPESDAGRASDSDATACGPSRRPPPLTAIAPSSRFAWREHGGAPSTGKPGGPPLSARPFQSQSGRARFFGDDAESLDAFSTRSDSWRGASVGSAASSIGSVPRWSKAAVCRACQCKFTFLTRRHHCRSCGHSFCFEHSTRRMLLPALGYLDAQRVCDDCFEWRSVEASAQWRDSERSDASLRPPASPRRVVH